MHVNLTVLEKNPTNLTSEHINYPYNTHSERTSSNKVSYTKLESMQFETNAFLLPFEIPNLNKRKQGCSDSKELSRWYN